MTRLNRLLPMMALTATLVVALATSGFAHRVMTPDDQALQSLALTLGLDVADICGDTDAAGSELCEACRLHQAMALAAPATASIVLELGLDIAQWGSDPQLDRELAHVYVQLARAPPTV